MSDGKKKGFASRSFVDIGTGTRFEAGQAVELADGLYANYTAAGLVSDRAPKSAPAPAPAPMPTPDPAPVKAR